MEYLTCAELAAKYGVSRQTVLHHVKRGTIKAVTSGDGIYMIPANAEVPPAWEHGEKGRVANARYGAGK